MAAEILLRDIDYSFPVDIWGVGCIFAEMLNKKCLFQYEEGLDYGESGHLKAIFRYVWLFIV